jgi:hypothetical protein
MPLLDDSPFLCADDVAAVFKISRSKAYREAHAYIASNGRVGIPAVRIGRSIRFLAEPIRRIAAGTDAR